jgi:DNA (cytosine-5)-methyltransferase 1
MKNHKTYPKLIGAIREKLKALGAPYVIENVYGAKSEMVSPVMLCGTMFGLGSGEYDLRRHRLFECSFPISAPGACAHRKPTVCVVGGRAEDRRRIPGHRDRGRALDSRVAREAMQIDWMTMDELCESIPPAYTEYVGKMLISQYEPSGTKPLLLDLFCGAGGASVGYNAAGFDVIGVDLNPMPNYPYTFIQADAMEVLDSLIAAGANGFGYDAIHASPPCQGYSTTKNFAHTAAPTYPKLIEPLRDALRTVGLPYVIENVEGAKAFMLDPTVLCGSQFGLTAQWEPFGKVGLRRHRLFESNFDIPDAGPHDHSLKAVPVYGHPQAKGLGKIRPIVMGISWMTDDEICEAIPPAYTKYIGGHLISHLRGTRDRYDLAA